MLREEGLGHPRDAHWGPAFQGTLAVSGVFLIIMTGEGVLLISRGWRPGVLLNSPQCTGQLHPKIQHQTPCQRYGLGRVHRGTSLRLGGGLVPPPRDPDPGSNLDSFLYLWGVPEPASPSKTSTKVPIFLDCWGHQGHLVLLRHLRHPQGEEEVLGLHLGL